MELSHKEYENLIVESTLVFLTKDNMFVFEEITDDNVYKGYRFRCHPENKIKMIEQICENKGIISKNSIIHSMQKYLYIIQLNIKLGDFPLKGMKVIDPIKLWITLDRCETKEMSYAFQTFLMIDKIAPIPFTTMTKDDYQKLQNLPYFLPKNSSLMSEIERWYKCLFTP